MSKKKNILKLIGFISVFFITISLITGIIIFFNSKYYKYNTATEYMKKGNYENAEKTYKTLNEYKDSKNKIMECKYQRAKIYLKDEKYIKAIKILSSITSYKDSKSILQETKYNYGIFLNKKSMFEKSNAYLKDVTDYKDSKKYIEKNNKEITFRNWKNKYTGTFLNTTYSNDKVVLSSGTILTRYLDYSSAKILISEDYSCTFLDDFSLKCQSKLWHDRSTAMVRLQDDKLIINYNSFDEYKTEEYSKKSNTLNRPDDYKEPEIGMSKNEVLNSTWGSPKKKNIDKFSWGTYEQWVYSNNRYIYIYIENDKVTSISN